MIFLYGTTALGLGEHGKVCWNSAGRKLAKVDAEGNSEPVMTGSARNPQQ